MFRVNEAIGLKEGNRFDLLGYGLSLKTLERPITLVNANRETKKMPDPAEVKRLIRDRIAPGRQIGHD